jgi:DNA polymerase-3 subunit chi
MRVDFYQLSRDPAEGVVPLLAQNTLKAGERLLVVSADDGQIVRISEALWSRKDSFLAHGLAGGPHQERQPILLADSPAAANGARYVSFADGEWRDEAEQFERVFLLFDSATIDQARATWRKLGEREDVERKFWKQDGAKWVEGP